MKWPLLTGSSWLWVCYLLPWQAALLEAELWQAHSLLIPVELHTGGWVGDAIPVLRGFGKLLV